MKTRIYLFFFFCIIIHINAQTHRFIYEYKFVPDSTKTDSIITENTRLEIFKDHSEFLSDLIAKKDSAIISDKGKGQNIEDIKIPDGVYKNKIYKSKKSVYSLEFIGIQPFKVLQNEKLNWILLSDIKKIQGYNCQKAILYYGNRKWEAWFTQEIPLQNGPYIFENLPGLIIEISDTKHQHSFLLIGNYKTDNTISNFVDKPYFPSFEVSKLQFNKKWNVYKKNPIGGTEQFMLMNPGLLSGEGYDKNGNKIDTNKRNKDEQNYAKKQIKENNNYINKELYK